MCPLHVEFLYYFHLIPRRHKHSSHPLAPSTPISTCQFLPTLRLIYFFPLPCYLLLSLLPLPVSTYPTPSFRRLLPTSLMSPCSTYQRCRGHCRHHHTPPPPTFPHQRRSASMPPHPSPSPSPPPPPPPSRRPENPSRGRRSSRDDVT